MKFIMGDIAGFGMVGWMYYDMTGYLIARGIFFAMAILAVIGLITVLKFLFTGRKKKETPGEKWMRTGRTD